MGYTTAAFQRNAVVVRHTTTLMCVPIPWLAKRKWRQTLTKEHWYRVLRLLERGTLSDSRKRLAARYQKGLRKKWLDDPEDESRRNRYS